MSSSCKLSNGCWEMIRGLGSIVLALAMCTKIGAAAADPFDDVAPSTVRIHVTGVTEGQQPINNWGTGFLISENRILTAFHVVGKDEQDRPIQWATIPNQVNPKIALEALDGHNTPVPLYTNPRVLSGDAASDVALLQTGGRYTPVSCSANLPSARSEELYGVGWRSAKEAFDKLGPGLLQGIDPGDNGRRRISFGSDRGNSGAPVFDRKGLVVGILTSGRDQVVDPGAAYTFVTMLSDVARLLPVVGTCLNIATTREVSLVGSVHDSAHKAVEAYVSIVWHGTSPGTEDIKSSVTDGKFSFRLDPTQLGNAKELELRFSSNGFQDQTGHVFIGNDGQPLPDDVEVILQRIAEDEAVGPGDPIDPGGRTLYFLPYTVTRSSPAADDVAQTLNVTLPDQIKYGIVTRLQSYYHNEISVETLTPIPGLTAANTSRLRKIGSRLNALAVVTGRAGVTAATAAENIVRIISEYILPDTATGLEPDQFVDDSIAQSQLSDPAFGSNLNRKWALFTTLALAEKELRTHQQPPETVATYLTRAKLSATTEEERLALEKMIAHALGAHGVEARH